MSIQSNINTMMAVGTAIASQTPAIKQRQENLATQKELKGIEETQKQSRQDYFNSFIELQKDLADKTQGWENVYNKKELEDFKNKAIESLSSKQDEQQLGLLQRSMELKQRLGQSGQQEMSKMARIRAIASTLVANKMPKKEDNVDKFYKELGGRK